MNKKIYYHNKFILLTHEATQTTVNQQIVISDKQLDSEIQKNLERFLEQPDGSDLIFICKNVNSFFEELKLQFKYIEAAGGLIKNNEKFLFIYRLDKWDLPKGKIDKGETAINAAVRECEEECSIHELKVHSELPSTYHIYPYKDRFALKTTYWYLMESTYSGPLIPQTQENIEKAEWLSPDDIKKMVVKNTYPSVLDLIFVITDNKK